VSARKLEAWQQAGLIDRATAERISAYEDQHARPLALWAIIGIGALAIGLGLISVVAANWDDIPGMLRLSIHFALILAVAAGLFWKRKADSENDAPNSTQNSAAEGIFGDAIVFVFAALGLTFFGHLGQYYQTSSPLWQPLLLWLLLFTPLLWLQGRGWLTAALWIGGMILTSIYYAQYYGEMHESLPNFMVAVLMSLPALIAAFSTWVSQHSSRANFWLRMEQLGLAALLFGFLGFQLFCEISGRHLPPGSSTLEIAGTKALFMAGCAAIVFLTRRTMSGQAIAIVLIAMALADILAAINAGQSAFVAGVIFMLFWVVVAFAAIRAGWRKAFQAAVAIIAIRLIVLSFQYADDLLGSGIGLIMAGLLTLGIAWGAVRFSKEFAPKITPINTGTNTGTNTAPLADGDAA
jgi:uncharacterized membrane protein